ncbi:MAG TPA: tetratricopeptide repeat protein [Flavobacteriales bacterium]|jgi:tetratricopeptide (TPR) repeat protein|nr:tetratricopeptide repeat protein [Flavobacteriales bacterium]HIO15749.1 tetratricopeptide repeat protein [Flavobacteriales bacterium]
MFEEENHMNRESGIDDLIKRYERMVESGENRYFDIEEFEMLIENYLGDGGVEKAQNVLHYASSLFPESLNLQLREAQIMAGLGSHMKAIPRLKTLLAFEPNNEEIYLTLASIYSNLFDHSKAIKYFKQALKLSDKELKSEIRIDIALEYENLGEWKTAIQILEKALDYDVSNESALFELAFCYDKINDIKSAVNFFEKYLDENPYSVIGWYNLGNSFHRFGSLKKAVDAYDFAIAIDPKYARAYTQKAEALITLENYAEALETYRDSLQMDKATPHTYCCMGECYERLEDYIEAENFYKKSLDIDSDFTDAYVGLGVLADLQSEATMAVRFFEQAVLLEPNHTDFRLLLAAALIKLAKPQDAEEQYATIINKEPNNSEAWEGRVDNLQRLNAHETALEILKEGLDFIPEPTHLRYQEFVSVFATGEEARALDLLDNLLLNHYDSASRIFNSFPDLLNDNRIADRYNRLKP